MVILRVGKRRTDPAHHASIVWGLGGGGFLEGWEGVEEERGFGRWCGRVVWFGGEGESGLGERGEVGELIAYELLPGR